MGMSSASEKLPKDTQKELLDTWYVYDGQCPLCQTAATYFKIKQACGTLHLLDARSDPSYPILQQIKEQGIDLDEGFVIIHKGRLYHGKDALRFMSDIGEEKNWFNRFNKFFHSEASANLFYPWMKAVRGLLLKIRGVQKIDNLVDRDKPIYQSLFGFDGEHLPHVIQRHYANRPYSDDRMTIEGVLDIELSWPVRLLAPLLEATGTLVPYAGKGIPFTGSFISTADTNTFTFDRLFSFPNKKPYNFRCALTPIGDKGLIEITNIGFGWHSKPVWQDGSVVMIHKGYVFKLFGWFVPLPLTWIIGTVDAIETPVDENTFDMSVTISHPLWGNVFGYKGRLKITKDV